MEKFKHIKPNIEYEQQAIDYIKEFYNYNSVIEGVGGLHRYLDKYDEWLLKLENDRNVVPDSKRVPTETFFLVRESDNKIVGMISIRLALNERFKRFGGNIGYSIRPTERLKGYNKINLYLGLLYCKENGIDEVLLDCDKDNLASSKTIQALGGRLVKEYYEEDLLCTVQDYIINVNESIQQNAAIYEPLIEHSRQSRIASLDNQFSEIEASFYAEYIDNQNENIQETEIHKKI